MRLFSLGIRVPSPDDKIIEEFIGNVSDQTDGFSVAHMLAPAGWSSPAHSTHFDEIIIVIKGKLTLYSNAKEIKVSAEQVCWVEPTSAVSYTNTETKTCEYWSVCIPAFRPDRVQIKE